MDQKNLKIHIFIWLATIIFLLISTAIFPQNIVLGTVKISKIFAAILNGLVLTAVIHYVPYIAIKLDLKLKGDKADLVSFFAANFVFIWILKKFAFVTGLGVSSILFVIILAVIITLVQFKVKKHGHKFFK